jgi:hypothetical protein
MHDALAFSGRDAGESGKAQRDGDEFGHSSFS